MNATYSQYKQLADAALEQVFARNWKEIPTELTHAMEYSLITPVKRLRPVLLLAANDLCGGDSACDTVLNYACAMEMIHTYSLIHDDLPGMDNDDYRRGRLSNHKANGEALAILAGDGLLNAAAELMLKTALEADCLPDLIKAMQVIMSFAGVEGMIAGQCKDLEMEKKPCTPEDLAYIHRNKTGKLIRAAVLAGGLLAGASDEQIAALDCYASHLGLAFQITDDILDITGDQASLGKPIGSDEKNDKATYPKLYGLDAAKAKAEECVRAAAEALAPFGESACFLQELALSILTRNH